MARRRGKSSEKVKADLFPFLSVLICTMGAMVAFLFGVIMNADNIKRMEEKILRAEAYERQQFYEDLDLLRMTLEDSREDRDRPLRLKMELEEKVKRKELAYTAPDELRKERGKQLKLLEAKQSRRNDLSMDLSARKIEADKVLQKVELTAEEVAALKELVALAKEQVQTSQSLKEKQKNLEYRRATLAARKKKYEKLENEKIEISETLKKRTRPIEELRKEIQKKQEVLAALNQEMKKERTVELAGSLEGMEKIPGAGRPVKTDYSVVYVLCEKDRVQVIQKDGSRKTLDMSDPLALQLERERLATTPNILVNLLILRGGERNFARMENLLRGIRMSRYPPPPDLTFVTAGGN